MSFGQRPKLIRMIDAAWDSMLKSILRPRGRTEGFVHSWHAGKHRHGHLGFGSSTGGNQQMRVSRHAAINRPPRHRLIQPHPMRSNGNRAGMRRSLV